MVYKDILNTELLNLGNYKLTISAVVSFVIVLIIASFLRIAIKKIILRKKSNELEEKKRYTVYRIVSYFLWVIAIVVGLEAAGLSISILLAGSAALLVGVGLGLQQTFNDLVSGVILLFEGSIKLNDVVVVDDQYGQITEIGLRTSKIVTRDNIIMIIPNSKFIVENVVNWSYNEDVTRFKVSVGVAYGSDVELVKETLLEAAKENDMVLDLPAPRVLFDNFGDSSLVFELLFWTDQAFEGVIIKSDLRFAIDKKFRDNRITIPFPQRDLHLKSGGVDINNVSKQNQEQNQNQDSEQKSKKKSKTIEQNNKSKSNHSQKDNNKSNIDSQKINNQEKRNESNSKDSSPDRERKD